LTERIVAFLMTKAVHRTGTYWRIYSPKWP